METSKGETGAYAAYLAGLDVAVRFQIDRYESQGPERPLGYLYNVTLAEETAGYTGADGAVAAMLPDAEVKNLNRHEDYRDLIERVAASPRGTWVRISASWDNGERAGRSCKFIMSTGGTPYIEGSGHGEDWTYEKARSRMIDWELYHSRERCKAAIEAEANAALAGTYKAGMVLKNLASRGCLYSTAHVVSENQDGTVTLRLTKPGSSMRYKSNATPTQVKAMIEDGERRLALRKALRAA